jgi:hypothetical protein
MTRSPDYRKAYRAAKRELSQLLSDQERIEKRLVVVRQSIQTLAALCESKGIEVSPSDEADILLKHTALADEIRSVLKSAHPNWLRPSEVKAHLERLGHDLSRYTNPQATIQMVLKRIVESGNAEEAQLEGKKVYRAVYSMSRLAALMALSGGTGLDPNRLPEPVRSICQKK